MIKEYDLREELDEVTAHIAEFSGNPTTWQNWILIFLKGLEKQAMDVNPSHQDLYDD